MMMTIRRTTEETGCGREAEPREGNERKALGRWIERHIAPYVPGQRCHCPGRQTLLAPIREGLPTIRPEPRLSLSTVTPLLTETATSKHVPTYTSQFNWLDFEHRGLRRHVSTDMGRNPLMIGQRRTCVSVNPSLS
jgi:hypothetical protein